MASIVVVMMVAVAAGTTVGMVVMVMMMVVVIVIIIIILFIIMMMPLDLADPCRGGCDILEVKHSCAEDFVEIHIGVVAVDDFRLWLDGADNGAYAPRLLGSDLGNLVEEYHIAELNLLYHKIFDILLTLDGALQPVAAVKLALHPERVDHGNYAVEARQCAPLGCVGHSRHRADGLGYGGWLADAARLDDDVVKPARPGQLRELVDEVGLQGAADTSILQGNEVSVILLLPYHAPFLDKRRVNVDLADIVDNHRETYSFLIAQYPVEQGGLAAAEIPREQQHRYFFPFHYHLWFCFCRQSYPFNTIRQLLITV